MASWIEFSLSSNEEDLVKKVSLICLMDPIPDKEKMKTKQKCSLLIDEILFLDQIDQLKEMISSQIGSVILLIHCHFYAEIFSIRKSLNGIIPIYIHCSHSPCEDLSKYLLNEIDVVRNDLDQLINEIIFDELRRKREKRPNEGLLMSIFDKNQLDRSTIELNGQFVQFQLLINCLLQMESSINDREEFLCFFQREYATNPSILKHVNEFKSYKPSSCLNWYTRETFVYKRLNKALRTYDIHLLFLFRFLIRDIKEELEHRQSKSPLKLYRHQVMSNEEFNRLKTSQGTLISMHSFLSTTIDREQAWRYLQPNCPNPNPKEQKILFEIDVEPYENSTRPVANIQSESEFTHEKEYLMMLGSIFIVKNIFHEEGIWIIQMSLFNENQSEYNQVYCHLKDQYDFKSSRYLSFAYVLIDMGRFSFSQFYLHRSLEDPSTDWRMFPKCYQALGKVSFENGFYQLSLEYYYRSLHLVSNFNGKDPLIAYLYNNIGEVYEKQGFLDQALHSFENALRLFKEISPNNDETFAWCYNNLGMIYYQWKNFDQAMFYLNKALKIKTVRLPKEHPCLGNTLNNLGNIYFFSGSFDKAIEHYHKAYEIFCKSMTPDHPSGARLLRNIGLTHEIQGRFRQANQFYQQSQQIRQRIFTLNHPDLSEINGDLCRISKKIRRYLLNSFNDEKHQ